MTDATKLPPLPEPFDYCYEWDGPYGTRKFSAAKHNGMTPTRSVPLFNADKMHAYAEAARAPLLAEIEALRKRAEDAERAIVWQPIETAPKDGSMFLCWVAASRWTRPDGECSSHEHDVSQVDFCWWRKFEESPDGGYFDNAAGQIGDSQAVTHWRGIDMTPIDAAIKGSAA